MIRSTAPINDEMAHQLYVLQVLTFNLLEDRMMTKMDPQDQVGTETGESRLKRRQHAADVLSEVIFSWKLALNASDWRGRRRRRGAESSSGACMKDAD